MRIALAAGGLVLVLGCSSSDFAVPETDTGAVVEETSVADAPVDISDTNEIGCVPETGPCDWATNCGCGTVQTCGVDGCIGAGTRPLDADCSTSADCARDLTCIGGRCLKKCAKKGTAIGCEGLLESTCAQISDSAVPSRSGLVCAGLCDPSADPAKTGCSSGSCRVGTSFLGVSPTYCENRVGVGSVDAACSFDSDCKAGLMCFGTSSSKVCRRWCSIGSLTCPVGQSCISNLPKTIVEIKGTKKELGTCRSG